MSDGPPAAEAGAESAAPIAAGDASEAVPGSATATVNPAPRPTSGEAESTAPQPEGGDDEDIRPGSLRIEPRVLAEMFGALYTGIRSHGPAAFGNHNIINNYGSARLTPIVSGLPDVHELGEFYAETDADKPLDDLLTRRSTALLTGPRNSGRFSTACMALVRRYGPDRVHQIVLPTGTRSESLVEDLKHVLEANGYVVRLPADWRTEAMQGLDGIVHQHGARLLLIRDEGVREHERHGAEVPHRHPDPARVFRRQLSWILRREHGLSQQATALAVDGYLAADDVQEELNNVYGPREVVAIVRSIAARHPVAMNVMREILSESQPRRRARAARILLPPGAPAQAGRHRTGQHERAFRVAYAVFRLRPLHYVFESAAWLLEEIDDAALRTDWGSMALAHPVEDLLGAELKADWTQSQDVGNSMSGVSRSAWIRDNGLRGAILDVAWHDFDSTRKSLIRWLDRMVRKGDDVMSRAAAETAGLLVHQDFDRVHTDLIDDWAAAASRRVRQAAAWTATISAGIGGVDQLMREKVRDWCHGANNYRRDTAARVYASGLEQPVLSWSMADLRRIAQDRMQLRSQIVAEGVQQLYRPERSGWLITELADWTRSPHIRVHAARALLGLAARTDTGLDDRRPELLIRLAAGEVVAADLAALWRIALIEPEMSDAAWRGLGYWLLHADTDGELRKPTTSLLGLLAGWPAMRRRIPFFLGRTRVFPDGVPEWVQHTMEDL